jgi:hypothetical protein
MIRTLLTSMGGRTWLSGIGFSAVAMVGRHRLWCSRCLGVVHRWATGWQALGICAGLLGANVSKAGGRGIRQPQEWGQVMFKLLTAINPAAGVATEVLKGLGGILLRYWWVIVLGVAVWHYAGLRVEVASRQVDGHASLEQSLETSRAAVGRAQGMRAAITNLEVANAELAAQVDQLTVNAAEWLAA